MPIDPVSEQTCLQFVKGSHKWNKWFHPKKVFFTGRNEVVAKVMFLLVSVIPSTGGGGVLPQCMLGYHTPQEARFPPGKHAPPPREEHSGIQSMSGQYASYWNAFLFFNVYIVLERNELIKWMKFSKFRTSLQLFCMDASGLFTKFSSTNNFSSLPQKTSTQPNVKWMTRSHMMRYLT